MTYLFDTNHAIAHLNGDSRLMPHLTSAQANGDTFATTTTVLAELYYGAYASQRIAENLEKLTAEEIKPGVILDYNADDNVVGIEILGLSKRVPVEMLKSLQFETA